MSKPIPVPARPAPSHTPILISADDTAPSQPVPPRPARCGVSWSQSRSQGPNGGHRGQVVSLSRRQSDTHPAPPGPARHSSGSPRPAQPRTHSTAAMASSGKRAVLHDRHQRQLQLRVHLVVDRHHPVVELELMRAPRADAQRRFIIGTCDEQKATTISAHQPSPFG